MIIGSNFFSSYRQLNRRRFVETRCSYGNHFSCNRNYTERKDIFVSFSNYL